MFSLFKNTEEEISAVFDIGNGSIGGALVKFSAHGQPHVLYTHREPVTFHDSIDSEKLLFLMERHLKQVAIHLSKEGMAAIGNHGQRTLNHIFCVFASPWYISQTKVITYEKDKPFLITKRVIEDIVRNEEKSFEKATKEGSYGHLFSDDVTAIERKIIQTKLNGYEVRNIYGKTVQSLELSLFTSVVANEILKKAEEVIRKSLRFKKIAHHSFALTSFSVIRDIFAQDDNFLFLDITAELSELSITKRGVLLETISFPSGRHTLIRSLSKVLKTSPEVALSLLTLYVTGAAEPSVKDKIERALSVFQKEWCDLNHKAFIELSRQLALPKKIFLTADDDTAPFFASMIEKEKCIQFPDSENDSGDGDFNVMFLDAKKVEGFAVLEPKAKSDSFLLMESIFFNKLFNL